MGEIADMIIDGILCEQCGQYIDEECGGYPRTCEDCKAEERREALRRKGVQSTSKRLHKQ